MATRFITTGTSYTGTTATGAIKIPDYFYDYTALGYYIEGTAQADWLSGSTGNDTIHGYAGDDIVYGQGGHDTIFGGTGNDQLSGDAGNDILDGGKGADVLIGGAGIDTVSYQSYLITTLPLRISLAVGGFDGDAAGDSYFGIENVIGSNTQDLITGDAGDNRLEGRGGNDHVAGGAGRDILIGGVGRDTLTGDAAGVVEQDTFVIARSEMVAGQPDVITDFQYGIDKLQLSGFSVADLGENELLAKVMIFPDGTVKQALGGPIYHFDASDKLFLNVLDGTLYHGEIEQDADGAWHMVHSEAVVSFQTEGPGTQDLLFV